MGEQQLHGTETGDPERERAVALAREQALRLRAEDEESRASFLAEAGTLLSSSLDYETTLAHLAQLSVDRIADWCAIDIVEPDGELHRLVIAHPDPAREAIAWELHRRHPPDHSLEHGAGAVIRSGQPELVPDVPVEFLEQVAEDAEHLRILRELRLRSYMIVPLLVGGEALGAITFVSESEDERYGAGDLRLAQELANRAAIAVQNARLYRAAEQARAQVTRILSSISDAFFALDEEWRFTYLNAQAEELLQRPREELIGTSIWQAFPEALGSTFERMYRRAVREGRTVRFEERFAPLGSWFEVQAYPSDGGLSVYFRNVTEQRRAREALRYGELRYRSLVEASAAIAWNTPASGEFGGEQPGWSAFTGQGPEEYRGRGWLEAIHPEDREETAAAWSRALESRSTYEVEHRVRRHDGEYRHMLVRGVPILTGGGRDPRVGGHPHRRHRAPPGAGGARAPELRHPHHHRERDPRALHDGRARPLHLHEPGGRGDDRLLPGGDPGDAAPRRHPPPPPGRAALPDARVPDRPGAPRGLLRAGARGRLHPQRRHLLPGHLRGQPDLRQGRPAGRHGGRGPRRHRGARGRGRARAADPGARRRAAPAPGDLPGGARLHRDAPRPGPRLRDRRTRPTSSSSATATSSAGR
jgi:PAS domain S-box-containing protein